MRDNTDTVVLVADDEPSTLALVVEHVRAKGFKVIEASDGDMAWQLAHQHLPDLVILDVMMPGMSGWEVCRKIRESLPLAHTGVIMLTGIGQNLNEMTSPLYGADTHVDKPFEFVDLDAKINATLKERRKGTFGRADHADEVDMQEQRPKAPSFAADDAPLTAPTGGRTASKTDDESPVKRRSGAVSTKKPAKENVSGKAKSPAKKASPKKAPPKPSKAPVKKASKKSPAKKASKKAPAKKSAKAPAKKAAKKSAPKPAPKRTSGKKKSAKKKR
jgi:DNA-binding response OmpR family regulator